MSAALIIELVSKIGIPAALALLNALKKPSVSIDEAIAALQLAELKSAQDYLDEAKAKLP